LFSRGTEITRRKPKKLFIHRGADSDSVAATSGPPPRDGVMEDEDFTVQTPARWG
jgi:hypothetical protein